MKKCLVFFVCLLLCLCVAYSDALRTPESGFPEEPSSTDGYRAVVASGTILKTIGGIVLLAVFIIACVSVERTKNEAIRIRELLENINKIEVARYKKEFSASESNKVVE